jgi:hypothetical protein
MFAKNNECQDYVKMILVWTTALGEMSILYSLSVLRRKFMASILLGG